MLCPGAVSPLGLTCTESRPQAQAHPGAQEFVPERWVEGTEEAAKRPQYAWGGFGDGPRAWYGRQCCTLGAGGAGLEHNAAPSATRPDT